MAITLSVRRFFRADHSKRWYYTAIGGAVIAFMIYEIVGDLGQILG